jgi:hypothetical protein
VAIPEALRHPPLLDALEGARVARFTREEWDAYIAAGMAIQNERGALSLARKEGITEGQARAILALLAARGVSVTNEARGHIEACKDAATLDRWIVRAAAATSIEEVIAAPAEPSPGQRG